MFTWISRFLIFVFVFQIFAPELTFAQKNSTATQTNDLWQSVSAQIEKQRQNPLSSAKTLEELEHLYAQQMTALADVYDQADVTDVVAFLTGEISFYRTRTITGEERNKPIL